jgi:hypothetical protein
LFEFNTDMYKTATKKYLPENAEYTQAVNTHNLYVYEKGYAFDNLDPTDSSHVIANTKYVKDAIALAATTAIPVYRLIYSDTSAATVGNTTTETSIVGNVIGNTSFSGTIITAGAKFIQRGYGIISTKSSSPGNIAFNFTISNFTLGLNSNVPASLANNAYEYEFEVTPFAIGTSQDIFYKGKITVYDNIGAIAYANSFNGKGTMTTTGTISADVKIQWVTADANNTITSRSNTLEFYRMQ